MRHFEDQELYFAHSLSLLQSYLTITSEHARDVLRSAKTLSDSMFGCEKFTGVLADIVIGLSRLEAFFRLRTLGWLSTLSKPQIMLKTPRFLVGVAREKSHV